MDRIAFAAVSRNYFNMPVWIAHRLGHFADVGLDVRIELHEGVDEVTDRLRDGRVQLAYGITEHVILDRESGGSLAVIGGNVNKLPFSLIAGKSIRTVEDLRGRTIGVSSLEAGSSSLVMKLLAARGLDYPADYRMKAVGPILARWELLQSGGIDAGLQGAPLNYIAEEEGYPGLIDPRREIPDFQFTSLNVDRRWADANPAILRRFMRAFLGAHRWFYGNRELSAEIATAETGISREHALRAWDEYTGDAIFPPDGDASDAAIQSLIDVSALIRAVPDRRTNSASGYVDRSHLRLAWQEAGTDA